MEILLIDSFWGTKSAHAEKKIDKYNWDCMNYIMPQICTDTDGSGEWGQQFDS